MTYVISGLIWLAIFLCIIFTADWVVIVIGIAGGAAMLWIRLKYDPKYNGEGEEKKKLTESQRVELSKSNIRLCRMMQNCVSSIDSCRKNIERDVEFQRRKGMPENELQEYEKNHILQSVIMDEYKMIERIRKMHDENEELLNS